VEILGLIKASFYFERLNAIAKTTENQESWMNQRIGNAKSVERCVGILDMECARK
jgi:tetrahydromethanopterin S-methyltransferase subunit G